ncbi:MAG TPA: hypothetical protein VFB56_11125, partial [Nitrospiraceae bacterium]|nr:hypothetical protein [Nitrospiraceae bacterium]
GFRLLPLRADQCDALWDRVPMTFAVAALTGAFLAERVDGRTGVVVGVALALFLPGMLVYWLASEARGAENLWPYLAGLYGSLGVATLMLVLFPSPYTHGGQAFVALAWFALAMPFDKVLDGWVYSLGGVMGGHAVKHLLAALAMFWTSGSCCAPADRASPLRNATALPTSKRS